MPRVEAKVDKKGNVKIEAFGFEGGSCLEATKTFEQAVGPQEGERNLKPEFYEEPVTTDAAQEVTAGL